MKSFNEWMIENQINHNQRMDIERILQILEQDARFDPRVFFNQPLQAIQKFRDTLEVLPKYLNDPRVKLMVDEVLMKCSGYTRSIQQAVQDNNMNSRKLGSSSQGWDTQGLHEKLVHDMTQEIQKIKQYYQQSHAQSYPDMGQVPQRKSGILDRFKSGVKSMFGRPTTPAPQDDRSPMEDDWFN